MAGVSAVIRVDPPLRRWEKALFVAYLLACVVAGYAFARYFQ